ncbi:MAG: GNAT family N-acetyltransferase, partial [Acidobacteriota bacterium]
NLRSLYETPHFPVEVDPESSSRVRAEAIIGRARAGGRTLLTEPESKELLAAYRIPVNETLIATGETEAVRHAAALGYPVALKILAEGVTHKSEIGGVHLDLPDAGAVRQAFRSLKSTAAGLAGMRFQGATVQRMERSEGFEVILGCVQDPQFGPVLLFGSGGLLAEIYRDRALALPPLNSTLARRMMEQTSLYRALRGFRGREPVDMPALEKILVRFSQLLVEQPWIAEIDVNPLLVSAQGHLVLDARVVLHDSGVSLQDLPGLAVRPYPIQYVWRWVMKDGTPVTIRPIRPEDEPLMVKFHETLSDLSVYFRYFHPMRLTQRVTHERLVRMCFIDYSREMALVVETKHQQGEGQEIVGVGRLIRMHGIPEAEFAIIVSDRIQKSGLGTELLGRLVEIGRAEKLGRITGDILPDNAGMLRVCEKLGFRCRYSTEEGVIKAEIVL